MSVSSTTHFAQITDRFPDANTTAASNNNHQHHLHHQLQQQQQHPHALKTNSDAKHDQHIKRDLTALEQLNPKPEEMVLIDAGGTLVRTSRKTLCKYPSSLLAVLFDPERDATLSRDPTSGAVLLDVDGPAFAQVVSWLRGCDHVMLDTSGPDAALVFQAKMWRLDKLVRQLGGDSHHSNGGPRLSQSALLNYMTISDCANGGRLALPGVDMSGLYLGGARLEHSFMQGACMQRVNAQAAVLTRSDMRGVDLSHAVLAHANLHHVDLSGAILTGANLHETNLASVNLMGADLVGCSLVGTNFTLANVIGARLPFRLSQAIFTSVDLSGRDFAGYDFKGTNLLGASLKGCSLHGVDLSQATIVQANLSDANLKDAQLPEELKGVEMLKVDLSGRDLCGYDFSGANLSGANLTGANLSSANFSGATLTFAKLDGANLQNADLSRANMAGATLANANMAGANVNFVVLPKNFNSFQVNVANVIGHPARLTQ